MRKYANRVKMAKEIELQASVLPPLLYFCIHQSYKINLEFLQVLYNHYKYIMNNDITMERLNIYDGTCSQNCHSADTRSDSN